MTILYEVELRGRPYGRTFTFDSREVAQDFATIQAGFNGFRYIITEVEVSE